MKKKNYHRLSGLLCISAGIISSAQANEPAVFELMFKQQKIPLEGATTLEVDSVGFRYGEVNYLPIRTDLLIGRPVITHKDDAASLGFTPQGYHAGLVLSAATSIERWWQVGAETSYVYHSGSEKMVTDKIDISWTQNETKVWLSFRLVSFLRLYGGATAINLRGKQIFDDGVTASRIELNHKERGGQYGGFLIETGNNGYIGIEGYGGNQRGGMIYFGTRYDN